MKTNDALLPDNDAHARATGNCGTPCDTGIRLDPTFFFFFKRSGAFLQQSSWRNLSQWIHPSVPPGLPHTSGTIVSCSRGTSRSVAALRTAYVFSPRFCFVDPVLTMSGRQEATITKGGLSYHLTLQVAELFFRFC